MMKNLIGYEATPVLIIPPEKIRRPNYVFSLLKESVTYDFTDEPADDARAQRLKRIRSRLNPEQEEWLRRELDLPSVPDRWHVLISDPEAENKGIIIPEIYFPQQ